MSFKEKVYRNHLFSPPIWLCLQLLKMMTLNEVGTRWLYIFIRELYTLKAINFIFLEAKKVLFRFYKAEHMQVHGNLLTQIHTSSSRSGTL